MRATRAGLPGGTLPNSYTQRIYHERCRVKAGSGSLSILAAIDSSCWGVKAWGVPEITIPLLILSRSASLHSGTALEGCPS
jgi:hypothetical protein